MSRLKVKLRRKCVSEKLLRVSEKVGVCIRKASEKQKRHSYCRNKTNVNPSENRRVCIRKAFRRKIKKRGGLILALILALIFGRKSGPNPGPQMTLLTFGCSPKRVSPYQVFKIVELHPSQAQRPTNHRDIHKGTRMGQRSRTSMADLKASLDTGKESNQSS